MSDKNKIFSPKDPYEIKKAEIKGLLTLPSMVLQLMLKEKKCSKPVIKDALNCINKSVKIIIDL